MQYIIKELLYFKKSQNYWVIRGIFLDQTATLSSSNCCFLICIQTFQEEVRWFGTPISLRIFQFVVIHTVKGFGIVNKAEVDVFLELSCFFR